MNTKWLAKNWILLLLALFMIANIINKVINKLSVKSPDPVDVKGKIIPTVSESSVPSISVSGDGSHYYLWAAAILVIIAIIWGNRTIKIIGVAGLILIGLLFTETIVNFDWNSVSAGKVVERELGSENTKWLWSIPVAGVFFLIAYALGKDNVSNLVQIILGIILICIIIFVSLKGGGHDFGSSNSECKLWSELKFEEMSVRREKSLCFRVETHSLREVYFLLGNKDDTLKFSFSKRMKEHFYITDDVNVNDFITVKPYNSEFDTFVNSRRIEFDHAALQNKGYRFIELRVREVP